MPDIPVGNGAVLECCGQIFFSPADLQAHMVVAHQDRVKKVETKLEPTVPKVVVKIPVTLHYQYSGTCDCGTPVETLTIDDPHKASNQALIAWCPSCKKQLQTKTVGRIK